MASTSNKNVEKELNRFTLQDLFDVVLLEFPELTWEEIQGQLTQQNAAMSKKNVIRIILRAIKNLTQEAIDARALKLELYHIGVTETRTWNAFRLKDKIPNFDERTNKLENIKSAVRRTGLLADIELLKFRGKFIIKAVKKNIRKNRGILRSAPIYLQYFLFQPFVFISKGRLDQDLISGIIQGLGYNKFSFCHLDGPNLLDLLMLLRNKDGGISSVELMEEQPNLDPEMRINENVSNYSQYAKRAKYAEKLFGKKPPQLEQISVTVKNDTWNTVNNFDAMEGVAIDGMELTISSTNVIELFKEMCTKGVFVTPMPPYIENILTAGRNKIKINPLV